MILKFGEIFPLQDIFTLRCEWWYFGWHVCKQDLPSFTKTKHDDGQNDCNDNNDDKWQDQYKEEVISKVPDRRIIHWCDVCWFIKSLSSEPLFSCIADNNGFFTLIHLSTKIKEIKICEHSCENIRGISFHKFINNNYKLLLIYVCIPFIGY